MIVKPLLTLQDVRERPKDPFKTRQWACVGTVLPLRQTVTLRTWRWKKHRRTEDFGPESEAAEHNLHKLSQDPGKGYTFSESRTEKLHPPVEGTYKENCLSLWWEKIQNKMASWNSGQYYVTTQIGKEFEK